MPRAPARLHAALLAVLLHAAAPGVAHAADAPAAADDGRDALVRQAVALHEHPPRAAHGEPVSFESVDEGERISGTLVAGLPYPYATLRTLLTSPQALCEMMFLHVNIKSCRVVPDAAGGRPLLRIGVGKRDEDAGSAGNQVDNRYDTAVDDDRDTRIALTATEGPFGTRDYRITVEAVPARPGLTALRFHYEYRAGAMARTAMRAYLSTVGRDKVGFSNGGDGSGGLVGGLHGATERNLMRYFIAIDTAASGPAGSDATSREARLRKWFAHAERHARQLHELSLDDYLKQKRPGPDPSGGGTRIPPPSH